MTDKTPPFKTKTGKVLTDADIETLADEAERGYDVEVLKTRRRGRPMLYMLYWCAKRRRPPPSLYPGPSGRAGSASATRTTMPSTAERPASSLKSW